VTERSSKTKGGKLAYFNATRQSKPGGGRALFASASHLVDASISSSSKFQNLVHSIPIIFHPLPFLVAGLVSVLFHCVSALGARMCNVSVKTPPRGQWWVVRVAH
jgi:hypothetical protein